MSPRHTIDRAILLAVEGGRITTAEANAALAALDLPERPPASEADATIALLEDRCACLASQIERLTADLADASTTACELAERYMRARLQDDDAADLIMHALREG